MDTTAIIAIAGILGTLGGGLGGHYLQARLKERGDRRTKLNELRQAVYLEAMTFAQREEAWLDWIQTDYASNRDFPAVAEEEIISAKMALFATEAVQAEWTNLVKAMRNLRWYLTEEAPELAFSDEGVGNVADLVAVRDALSLLRNALRHALAVSDQ